MRVPLATYRLQFNQGFNFQQATELVLYLEKLGISDIYASPVFKACSGSGHGYDVIDPNRLNPELGTGDDFKRFNHALTDRGMGWIQDIVPNHMAYTSENPFILDVWEKGEQSDYISWFDIQWDNPVERLRHHLLAPFLGKYYAESIESGEIRVSYDKDGFFICYYDWKFPLRLASYLTVLRRNLERLEEHVSAQHPGFIQLLGAIHLFESLNDPDAPPANESSRNHAKHMLWQLFANEEVVRNHIEQNLAELNEVKPQTAVFASLDNLLSDQFYHLSFWKVANEEINYRRFFGINDLICVRVEDENVFQVMHQLIFQWLKEGRITGLRIDHLDGLYHPRQYLERLSQHAPDCYVMVEKILNPAEDIPCNWPVQGATGYDFLHYVNGVFCRQENKTEFQKLYYHFTRLKLDYAELCIAQKRRILDNQFQGNLDNLAFQLKNLAGRDRRGRDMTFTVIKRVLTEIIVRLPVYRTYIDEHGISEQDKTTLQQAFQQARQQNILLEYEFDLVETLFLYQQFRRPESQVIQKLSTEAAEKLEQSHQCILDFIMAFQQFTGAITAKAIEDTVFYIYNRLISLNEVGGAPGDFGAALPAFHQFLQQRADVSPHALNTTATHDTKRGEDVRQRINVLSEIPDRWKARLRQWAMLNGKKKKKIHKRPVPDKNEEYYLYQTLLGAYPHHNADKSSFIERIKEHFTKALREAKIHTSWMKPDMDYEKGCEEFIESILRTDKDNPFLEDFEPFQRKISDYGIYNSLSQSLIKITAPGVPDFYQGGETWDLNLVDPDNRRPVDYIAAEKALDNSDSQSDDLLALLNHLWKQRADGGVKQYFVNKALQFRRANRALFEAGNYVELAVEGDFQDCVIAFARRHEDQTAVIAVPRFLTQLTDTPEIWPAPEAWKNTALSLEGISPGLYRNALTANENQLEGSVSVGELFDRLPFAILNKCPIG